MTRSTNRAQDALDAKLKQIEALVASIEYFEAQEELQAQIEELEAAQGEAKSLKKQIEDTERELADIEGKFKKYQASVDAGYDDNETMALRDSCGRNLEEIHEEWVKLRVDHAQVVLKVSELKLSVYEHRVRLEALEALKDGYEPTSELSLEEAKTAINSMVLCTEYRSGWSVSPSDLEATQVRMTLAIGGPSIYLTADYDDGEISNAELSCVYYDEQACTQSKQDALLKFMMSQ